MFKGAHHMEKLVNIYYDKVCRHGLIFNFDSEWSSSTEYHQRPSDSSLQIPGVPDENQAKTSQVSRVGCQSHESDRGEKYF